MKLQRNLLHTGVMVLLMLLSLEIQAQYKEKYRPQFHFSPKKGWIGDPDGLVFTDGKYHLFWWGHAVSEDLVHWKELPYPMKGGDSSFSYFSGSVVVDKNNTSGFGMNSMIAVYTKHLPGDSLPETQALSVSNDGIYFHYYEHNPVLDINKVFFRDAQVFWYEPEQKWVMVVVLPDVQKIHIYDSKDLKSWNYLSDFSGLGAQNSFWECPDLFELPLRGTDEKKWVMLIGRGANRVQYFVGSFDGKDFKADEETISYLQQGKGLPGQLFAGFDVLGFNKWKVSGNAFTTSPANLDSVVCLGKRFATSFDRRAEKVGKLTSPSFTIRQNAINFLVAGGRKLEKVSINLVVDGRVVRTSAGENSHVFKWNGWDVKELKGKKATIQIIDNSATDDWGFIAVDHIMFSDVLMNQNLEHSLWLDYGPDFYAARTWRDIDEKTSRTIMLGWLGNWDYSRIVPTTWGKGFESVPREIRLQKTPMGTRLIQSPVPELKKLRRKPTRFSKRVTNGTYLVKEFMPTQNVYELDVTFDTNTSAPFGLNLLVGDGRKLIVQYDPATSNLSVDRTQCTDFTSNFEFNQKFPAKMNVVVLPDNNQLRLHILVDQSSIEIFANQGEVVVSALTFPAESQTGLELFSVAGTVNILDFKAWELSSIWTDSFHSK